MTRDEEASHEVVRTRQDALAMLDRETGEVMHPVTGPLLEVPQLYITPSRLLERLREPADRPLVLYDVGLGAGSNATAARAVSEARTEVERRLHILSFDRTTAALELAREPQNAAAFGLQGEAGDAARTLLEAGCHETRATTWTLVVGELPDALTAAELPLADIVYWDPFSPRQNPELWSVRSFRALRSVCGPRTTVHTYGAATATRSALLLAGFFVGRGHASASKSESTIAATKLKDIRQPLDTRWLARLGRSSAPFPPDAPTDAMRRIERHAQLAVSLG